MAVYCWPGSWLCLTACIGTAVIPWGSTIIIGDRIVPLQVTDINVGILYIFGVVSLGVYGVMIGGWASNNKYSLLGAIRAASQNISYEIAMGLSIIALLLMTDTLSLKEIVEQQHGWHWNVLYQPLGFLIFIVCAFAETNRAPFDLPECETELIGGYHTEYSSMKLGFYLFAEYINMFVSSAVMATLIFWWLQLSWYGLHGNITRANLGTAFRYCCVLCQNICLHLLLHVGTLDHPAFPL